MLNLLQVNEIEVLECSEPMSDQHVQQLVEGLKKNTSVRVLDVSKGKISGEGMEMLVKALRKNTIIQRLVLSGCSLQGTNLFALSCELKNNYTLTSLDISNCRLHNQANAFFQDLDDYKSITSLNVSRNEISRESLATLFKALTRNCSVASLDLSHNQITGVAVQGFAHHLSKTSYLSSVNLSCNCISERGLIALADSLRENKSLSHLDISQNQIQSYRAVKSLSRAIAHHTTLARLDFRGNYLDDETFSLLLTAAKHNRCLSELDMSGNEPELDVHKLEAFLSRNKQINHQWGCLFATLGFCLSNSKNPLVNSVVHITPIIARFLPSEGESSKVLSDSFTQKQNEVERFMESMYFQNIMYESFLPDREGHRFNSPLSSRRRSLSHEREDIFSDLVHPRSPTTVEEVQTKEEAGAEFERFSRFLKAALTSGLEQEPEPLHESNTKLSSPPSSTFSSRSITALQDYVAI